MIEALLIGVVSVIGAFLAGMMRGKSTQKQLDETRQLAAAIEAERKRREVLQRHNEVQRETSNLPTGGAADRLRDKWSRD